IASVSGGAEAAIPPKTTEQKIAKKNKLKAKITLLLAIPDTHLLKFHGIKDAKTLWEDFKTRLHGEYAKGLRLVVEDLLLPIQIHDALVPKTILLYFTKRTMCHGRPVFSGDTNREVPVNETFYVQTNDELTEKELKQIEADDQAIQTILFGLPKDIYAAVDSCETAQEIWLRVQQMMKGSD
nr:ribonuclease H-like domain-containing protein [Tanacetum cinerariifolium]